jgi:hypothetical protein
LVVLLIGEKARQASKQERILSYSPVVPAKSPFACHPAKSLQPVIPAKAGIQALTCPFWFPAFAGMTTQNRPAFTVAIAH